MVWMSCAIIWNLRFGLDPAAHTLHKSVYKSSAVG
jgi:hypothetical protein